MNEVSCSNFCLNFRKVSKGWIILISTFTLHSLDSLYPVILTGKETLSKEERLRTIFQKRRLYVEIGAIGFCCGIMNEPQTFAKVCTNRKDWFLLWYNERSDDGLSDFGLFVCGLFSSQAGYVNKLKEKTDIG